MPKNVLIEPPKVPPVPPVPPRPSTVASFSSSFSPPVGPPNFPPPRTVNALGHPPSHVPPNGGTKQLGPNSGLVDPPLWKPLFNEQGLASPSFIELLSAVFKRLDPNNTGALIPEAFAEFCSAMEETGEANLCKPQD